MRPRPPLPAGPYLVVGLVRSGVAAALALRARGAEVIGVDRGGADRPDLAENASRLSAAGVEVQLDASGDAVAARAGTLIKSPGVPQTAPAVLIARARGIPVLGELELGWRLLPNEFIAVTGTNGKTTTTEWIGHIHREAALPVAVAGNVGTALTSLVGGAVSPQATIVCEASSFQLEDTDAFAPEAAVLLNLTPDHLDRHGSLEAYVAAKLRIFAQQGNDDVAVAPEGLGIEDLGGCARRVCFGTGPEAELQRRNGHLWWDGEPLIAEDELGIPGAHNAENAMAAAAVTLARGIDVEAVAAGLRSFRGVAHRLELVATSPQGVAFVNDSKATNVASTLVALAAYRGGRGRVQRDRVQRDGVLPGGVQPGGVQMGHVHLIAGGVGKGQDFSPLAEPVARHCRGVYLIGEDAGGIASALKATGVPLTHSGTLDQAVSDARASAEPGDVVLLSPACASFDQYPNFEARGEHFRALVSEA